MENRQQIEQLNAKTRAARAFDEQMEETRTEKQAKAFAYYLKKAEEGRISYQGLFGRFCDYLKKIKKIVKDSILRYFLRK